MVDEETSYEKDDDVDGKGKKESKRERKVDKEDEEEEDEELCLGPAAPASHGCCSDGIDGRLTRRSSSRRH